MIRRSNAVAILAIFLSALIANAQGGQCKTPKSEGEFKKLLKNLADKRANAIQDLNDFVDISEESKLITFAREKLAKGKFKGDEESNLRAAHDLAVANYNAVLPKYSKAVTAATDAYNRAVQAYNQWIEKSNNPKK
jgi:hypothetical protein